MTTFAELGIPFALFDAPVDEAADYVGQDTCSLCGVGNRHCFELGIGADVMVSCQTCGHVAALDAYDHKDGDCTACVARVKFPNAGEARVLCCYECLRAGSAAFSKDTELGMIGYVEAVAGVSHGRPRLARSDFELVPLSEGWTGAKVPTALMLELVRTPSYLSIQGEQWQFCCAQPMTYVGAWSAETFDEMAPDGEGRALFDAIVPDASDELWKGELHDETGIYVFRCSACGKHAAHWDMA